MRVLDCGGFVVLVMLSEVLMTVSEGIAEAGSCLHPMHLLKHVAGAAQLPRWVTVVQCTSARPRTPGALKKRK